MIRGVLFAVARVAAVPCFEMTLESTTYRGWWNANYIITSQVDGSLVGFDTLEWNFERTDVICAPRPACYTLEVTPGRLQFLVEWTLGVNGTVMLSGGAPETVDFVVEDGVLRSPMPSDSCGAATPAPSTTHPEDQACFNVTMLDDGVSFKGWDGAYYVIKKDKDFIAYGTSPGGTNGGQTDTICVADFPACYEMRVTEADDYLLSGLGWSLGTLSGGMDEIVNFYVTKDNVVPGSCTAAPTPVPPTPAPSMTPVPSRTPEPSPIPEVCFEMTMNDFQGLGLGWQGGHYIIFAVGVQGDLTEVAIGSPGAAEMLTERICFVYPVCYELQLRFDTLRHPSESAWDFANGTLSGDGTTQRHEFKVLDDGGILLTDCNAPSASPTFGGQTKTPTATPGPSPETEVCFDFELIDQDGDGWWTVFYVMTAVADGTITALGSMDFTYPTDNHFKTDRICVVPGSCYSLRVSPGIAGVSILDQPADASWIMGPLTGTASMDDVRFSVNSEGDVVLSPSCEPAPTVSNKCLNMIMGRAPSWDFGWDGVTYSITQGSTAVTTGTLPVGFTEKVGFDRVCLPEVPGCYKIEVSEGGDYIAGGIFWDLGNGALSGLAGVESEFIITTDGDVVLGSCTQPPTGRPTLTPAPSPMPGGKACFDLRMEDSWGDGWGGAEYFIFTKDGNTTANGTLATGSQGVDRICGTSDTCYTFNVTEGTHPREISWDLANGALTGGAPEEVDFLLLGDDDLVSGSCS